MWPHQGQVLRGNHFPASADHTVADLGQDATGLTRHLGTCWLIFSQLWTSIPRLFSAGHLSSHSAYGLEHCTGLLWPKCRTQDLVLLVLVHLCRLFNSPHNSPVLLLLQALHFFYAHIAFSMRNKVPVIQTTSFTS